MEVSTVRVCIVRVCIDVTVCVHLLACAANGDLFIIILEKLQYSGGYGGGGKGGSMEPPF